MQPQRLTVPASPRPATRSEVIVPIDRDEAAPRGAALEIAASDVLTVASSVSYTHLTLPTTPYV